LAYVVCNLLNWQQDSRADSKMVWFTLPIGKKKNTNCAWKQGFGSGQTPVATY